MEQLNLETMRKCENLVRTYDTNVIDEMPWKLRRAFERKTDTDACVKKRENRPVLDRLVANHFANDKPKPLFIGGPQILTVHWNPEYEKLIYIFGEHHLTSMDCVSVGSTEGIWDSPGAEHMSIEYFLKNLIPTNDVFTDILIELPPYPMKCHEYIKGPDYKPCIANSRLDKLFEEFRVCLQRSTRHAAECGLARVHFFDIRSHETYDGNGMTMFYQHFRSYGHLGEKYIRYSLGIPHFKSLISDICKCVDLNSISDYLIEKIFSNIHNQKELAVAEPEPRTAIIAFLQAELRKKVLHYGDELKTNCCILNQHFFIPAQEVYTALKMVCKSFLNIDAITPDIYILARIFKIFDINNPQKPAYTGAVPGDQPNKAHNIIIYAGDTHAARYRKFLRDVMHFTDVAKTGRSSSDALTCINMKNIKPFFSKESKLVSDEVSDDEDEDYKSDEDYEYDDFVIAEPMVEDPDFFADEISNLFTDLKVIN